MVYDYETKAYIHVRQENYGSRGLSLAYPSLTRFQRTESRLTEGRGGSDVVPTEDLRSLAL